MKLLDYIQKLNNRQSKPLNENNDVNTPKKEEVINKTKDWFIDIPTPDDRNRCVDCSYLRKDYCQINWKIGLDSRTKPIKNILKRCKEFKLRQLTNEEIGQLNSWLEVIGEKDQNCIKTVFKACNESAEKRNYYFTLVNHSKIGF